MAAMIEHYSYVNMVVTSLGNNGAIVLFKSPILADNVYPVASFTFKPSGGEESLMSKYTQRTLWEKRASMKLWTPLEQVTFIGGLLTVPSRQTSVSLCHVITGTLTAAAKIPTPGRHTHGTTQGRKE